MAIKGNITEVSLPTLVQLFLHEGQSGCIRIQGVEQIAWLYIADNRVCHAVLAKKAKPGESILTGHEVIYELLGWSQGEFTVQYNIEAPEQTITHDWDFLLFEGLRQLDEAQATQAEIAKEDEQLTIEDGFEHLSEEDANALRQMLAEQVEPATDILLNDEADVSQTSAPTKEQIKMANIQQTLEAVMEIEGAVAAALVDWESGLTLGTIGSGIDIDLAAAGNTNVVRAKLSVMRDLKLKGSIEDILITLSEQYHLIRLLHDNKTMFLYLALNRSHANLGLARHRLIALEEDLEV